uniref:Uncharacterized protein n=1 Tax=Arion vulgaris TaxID=1028688 RepID=A0A0B7A7R3_9EUPU
MSTSNEYNLFFQKKRISVQDIAQNILGELAITEKEDEDTGNHALTKPTKAFFQAVERPCRCFKCNRLTTQNFTENQVYHFVTKAPKQSAN